jgi:hypothetical protein
MDSLLILSSGNTAISFNKRLGIIVKVTSDGAGISFGNGPVFAGMKAKFVEMKHFPSDDKYTIELFYENQNTARWTMLPGGSLRLDYEYHPEGELDFAGITFSYPEILVTGADLLSDGPFRVWKNRLKGTQFGLFRKEYNNTVTGQSWLYPEFKGYYSNFYAVQLRTKELPITIASATSGLYLHLFTPGEARYSTTRGVSGSVNPSFPEGNISFLHAISAIGTKFSKPETEGPQGEKNVYKSGISEACRGTLYFRFGK